MNEIFPLPGISKEDDNLQEPSLFDALVMIENDTSIPAVRRTQWCCTLRRVPVFLARDPRSLPARMSGLRYGLQELHHTNLGISKKSLQNHMSNLRAALRHSRGQHKIPAREAPLTSGWQHLSVQLTTIRLQRGLSSFVRFCSDFDIAPMQVRDEAVDRFIANKMETSFTKRPHELQKQVARCWNEASGIVADWPKTRLTLPDFKPKCGKRLEDFAERFAQDVEQYLAWLGGAVLFDRPEVERPNKQSTVNTRRREIVGAVNAALEAGYTIEGIGSLSALVEPECVRKILEVYLARADGEPKVFTIELAGKFVSIARHWCRFPDKKLTELQTFATRLGKFRKSGLTPKNLALVRQIKQPQVWRRICHVPETLMNHAARDHNSSPCKAAVNAQIAVAIMMLIVAPMRIGNLVKLRMSENLSRPAGPDGPIHIVIPDYDVKNEIALEFPLPLSVSRMVDQYIFNHRARLTGPLNDYLFPARANGCKGQSTLSQQITERLWKQAGVRMTPHQFRHAAAAIILDSDPGNYELVRRLLAHKNIQTTINFYIGLESIDAAKHFAELVLKKGGVAP